MKKFLCVVISGLILLSFSACKSKKDIPSSSSSIPVLTPSKAEQSSVPTDAVPEPQPEPEPEPVHIGVEQIKLSAYEKTFNVGERFMPIVTMLPENATDKSEIWVSDNTNVATVNSYGRITAVGEGKCTVTVTSADNKSVSAAFAVTVNAPAKIELKYVDGILIANKSYPLPSNYNPGTNPEAKAAFDNMAAAAAADGLKLFIRSGFRSYTTQRSLYNGYVKRDGAAAADRYSARPGYSEHQTGFAFDINKADSSFIGTPEAIWLANNAYKFGFILRYPEGKESVTGYMYEPWHYRYVGVEKAAALYNSGLTIEEYYGITSCYAQ